MKGKAESETRLHPHSWEEGEALGSQPQGLMATGDGGDKRQAGKEHHRSSLGLDSPLAKAKHVLLL